MDKTNLITLFHKEAQPMNIMRHMVRRWGWKDANGRMSFCHKTRIHRSSARRSDVLLLLIGNALENSFAAHIEIFHEHLCGLAVGADGKGNAASADSVFALRLISERIPIIVRHRESLVFWALHDC